mgnify:CR=1 FL=1
MASARARLGAARRGIIKRKKQTGVVTGALSALGTVAAFGAGQVKKADTAWGEYEAGYKELGGDVKDIQKPGFFKRTAQQFLPGGKTGLPEGEVRVGATMYDRSKIQKAGSFLGSDAAAALTPEMREKYLGRTAPGRDMTAEEVSTTRESLRPKSPYELGGFKEDDYDVDEEFPMDGDIEYNVNAAGVPISSDVEIPKSFSKKSDWEAHLDIRGGKSKYFANEAAFKEGKKSTPSEMAGLWQGGQDWATPLPPTQLGIDEPTQESESGGVDPKPRGRGLGSMWSSFIKAIEAKGSVSGGTSVKTGVSQIPKNPYSYQNMLNIGTAQSYAHGGDFITNGPQEILVGDNASGRERVTITPLDLEDYKPKGYHGKKRNWLEALYENNRRRKKY